MKKISIVVPVYFNESSLNTLFDRLLVVRGNLAARNILTELIFVDDGSGDGSLAILRRFKADVPEIIVIKLTRNFGAMSAARAGLSHVTGDAFIILAADLQDPPGLIPQMVDRWLEGAKYIICQRLSRADPISSKIFSAFYYGIVRKLIVKNYPKKGFDLALMDSKYLPFLLNSGKHINISLFSFWLGIKPIVISYDRIARASGKSRWTFTKKLKLFFDSIFSFSAGPIRVISITGMFFSLLSFAYGFVVILSAILGKSTIPGYAATISILTFLLGLIIIMLGIIGEYVWRIFDEVSNHPHAVIEEII